jgi:hypothetical protein
VIKVPTAVLRLLVVVLMVKVIVGLSLNPHALFDRVLNEVTQCRRLVLFEALSKSMVGLLDLLDVEFLSLKHNIKLKMTYDVHLLDPFLNEHLAVRRLLEDLAQEPPLTENLGSLDNLLDQGVSNLLVGSVKLLLESFEKVGCIRREAG